MAKIQDLQDEVNQLGSTIGHVQKRQKTNDSRIVDITRQISKKCLVFSGDSLSIITSDYQISSVIRKLVLQKWNVHIRSLDIGQVCLLSCF